jgi:hypothetical protein
MNGLFDFLEKWIEGQQGGGEALRSGFFDSANDITRGVAQMSGANPQQYGLGQYKGLMALMDMAGMSQDQKQAFFQSLNKRKRGPRTSSYPAQRRRQLFGNWMDGSGY